MEIPSRSESKVWESIDDWKHLGNTSGFSEMLVIFQGMFLFSQRLSNTTIWGGQFPQMKYYRKIDTLRLGNTIGLTKEGAVYFHIHPPGYSLAMQSGSWQCRQFMTIGQRIQAGCFRDGSAESTEPVAKSYDTSDDCESNAKIGYVSPTGLLSSSSTWSFAVFLTEITQIRYTFNSYLIESWIQALL